MFRRKFLAYGLMLLGCGHRARGTQRGSRVGVGVWAQLADAPVRYARLSRPVKMPLDAVTIPWQPVKFTAEAMSPSASATPSRRVLISGVLFRRVTADDRPPLSALCLTCPHEQCQVDLITDPTQLAKMIGPLDSQRLPGAGDSTIHPLFECGCHFSVFDALEDGARIAGETPRGLYRFRVNAVKDGTVEINEVEEEALFAV